MNAIELSEATLVEGGDQPMPIYQSHSAYGA
jgi:hypothetical protein